MLSTYFFTLFGSVSDPYVCLEFESKFMMIADAFLKMMPAVAELFLKDKNPYTPSKISSVKRPKEFRENLIATVYPASLESNGRVHCMVSGLEGNGQEIVAAHILPADTKSDILKDIPMDRDELVSPRNGLFLAKEIERAFDRLQISFVAKDVLNPECLVMVIWDERVKETPLWKEYNCNGQSGGSCSVKIGDCENFVLKLRGHNPIKRGLSYQAAMAYASAVFTNLLSSEEKPPQFGTPEKLLPSKMHEVLDAVADRSNILARISSGRNYAVKTEREEDDESCE